jgi:uncharacterized membrane protein YfcA
MLVGSTGVGGAAIMTPLLVLAFRVNPMIAVGTDLVYSVPTRLYGAYLHARQGTVNWKITQALLAGGLPASVLGIALLYWLRHHIDIVLLDAWTRRAIAIVIFIAAAIMLLRPLRNHPTSREAPQDSRAAAARDRIAVRHCSAPFCAKSPLR